MISVKIGGWLVLVMGELNEWAGRQYFCVVMATMTSKADDLRHRHSSSSHLQTCPSFLGDMVQ